MSVITKELDHPVWLHLPTIKVFDQIQQDGLFTLSQSSANVTFAKNHYHLEIQLQDRREKPGGLFFWEITQWIDGLAAGTYLEM